MTTMNISLPEALKAFVDEQVAARGYASSSEYVRDLLRREREHAALAALLREGAESGPGVPVDDAFFARMRGRARGE
jgi:antitoxin ParD1/3/4